MSSDKWESNDEYWDNRYQQGETGWDRGAVHPALIDWLASGKLQLCKILIPGCGRGYEVIHLAKLGFQVTAVDFAVTPINELSEKLKQHGLKAELIHADFFNLSDHGSFDAIYEQTCLCAIKPTDRKRYEKKAHDLIRPNGLLLSLFMQTNDPETGPPFHCDLNEMKALFDRSRWIWEAQSGIEYPHPAGVIHEIAMSLLKK